MDGVVVIDEKSAKLISLRFEHDVRDAYIPMDVTLFQDVLDALIEVKSNV